MALKFNTFRAQRYLRSRFVEGKFLLASEGSDIELELIDLLRNTIQVAVGNVTYGDGWRLVWLSSTTVLLQAGEAWLNGLPILQRSGADERVSGDSLSAGLLPSGVTVTDDSLGRGKIITFTNGTTPSNTYSVVITAQEQLITSVDDPFLQNANLTESTEQKMRLVFLVNVVPTSAQTATPIPYTNDTSDQNLTNDIIISPTSGGNGELLAVTVITGSEEIDGRNLELTIRNNPSLGGGNPIPNGTVDQQAFSNGMLIDSNGTEFWVNAIFNDVVSNQVIIRLDKEVNQPNPVLTNGSTYTLIKRDVYVTDDTNGNPLGKLFYTSGSIVYSTSTGVVSQANITDLRKVIQNLGDMKADIVAYLGSAYIKSQSQVTWDGSVLNFPSDIILETRNTVDGGLTLHTIPAADSPLTINNGDYIYILINREVNENPVTVFNSSITPIPPAEDLGGKDIFVLFHREDYSAGNFLFLPFNKQVLKQGQTVYLGASGSGSGVVIADLYDLVNTTLPAGSSYTADGVAATNGQIVLFSNLSSNNNRLYQIEGVGTSITWTPVFGFANGLIPQHGELVYIKFGNGFADQIGKFDGTTYEFNSKVRYFNGADYVEFSAIDSTTLLDNSSGDVFTVNASGSENWQIHYSLARGSAKASGILYLTHNGTTANVVDAGVDVSTDIGVDWSASISSGTLHLSYTTTSTGTNINMKFFYARWSDAAGGPGGVPSYTGASSSTAAGGNPGDVQFNSGGFLSGSDNFKYDSANNIITLNGLNITGLTGPLTINDNQTSPLTLFSLNATTQKTAIVEYSMVRGVNVRTGRILLANNGATSFDNDDSLDSNISGGTGVTLSSVYSSGNVNVQYISDSQGVSGSFKYTVRYWN